MSECLVHRQCNKIQKKRNSSQLSRCEYWQRKFDEFLEECRRNKSNIMIHKHCKRRCFERCISEQNIKTVIEEGEIIEYSQNEIGIVRLLVFSYIKTRSKTYRPIHAVLEISGKNSWTVITVYSPESQAWKWNDTYNERVCFLK